MCIEAMNAGLSVEQLMAAKEVEVEAAAKKAAEAEAMGKSGADAEITGAPIGEVQPSGDLAASSKAVKTTISGVKRPSGGTLAFSAKRARKKPESLGTRDG